MSALAGIFQRDGAFVDRSRLITLATAPPVPHAARVTTWEGGIGLAYDAGFELRTGNDLQPLVDSASGCVIVFEGRLDNRAELFAALKDDRRLLEDASDAALVLGSYLLWGETCAQHLIGDFVFAIWNPGSKELLLARDPLGQRPLYYAETRAEFIFASTLEQLLRDPALPRELHYEILPYYIYAYSALSDATPYRGIKSLPGGHCLIADAQQVRIEKYWDRDAAPLEPRALTDDDVSEFQNLFAQAVRCRLRGDAPVGLLLSGGLDSGAIACMAGHLRERDGACQVHAYSFVFEKFSECDERVYINAAVARSGVAHTPINGDDSWTFSCFEPWLSVFSEPFFAPYDPLIYKTLAQARADGVRVMLMGHGGDIVLDGSPRYFADWLLAGRWRDLHRQVYAYAASAKRSYAVGLLGNAVTPWFPSWARRAIEFRHAPRLSALIPAHLRVHHFDAAPALHRGRNAWWYDYRDQLSFGQTPHEAYLDRLMRLFGMEVRQPFLDVRLIQFLLRLPPEATYSDGKHRAILRAALRDILPPEIRDRTTKTSFVPLMDYGLRVRRADFVRALTQDSEIARRGYVVPAVWQRALENYLRGATPLASVYWNSLVVEMWLRIQTGRLPPLG